MQKRNFDTHEYEQYAVSPDWNCPLTAEMEELIQCANCGCMYEFGEMYTSQRIHNSIWFGYPVCEKCYNEESILRRNAEEIRKKQIS
jgi:hypothetical protein